MADPATGSEERALHVSAYVDCPLTTVVDRLAAPTTGALLAAAVQAGLDAPDAGLVEASAGEPTWVSCSHARVPVGWRSTSVDGRVAEGAAVISLLVVQSGAQPVTELLATVPLPGTVDDRSLPALHRILQELASRLEAPSA